MSRPSREQIETMAFMAMMEGSNGFSSIACTCPTCKSDRKSNSGTKYAPDPSPLKARKSTETESGTCNHKHEAHATHCIHHHARISRPTPPSTKKSANATTAPEKSATTTGAAAITTAQGREHKINSLLKAFSEKVVFEVCNQTDATVAEKELAQSIQNAAKDSKAYVEVKQKIMDICADKDVELNAVYGLLAKFRHERNLLTTAILKSNTERELANTEREKALLCIKRVDDLMHLLKTKDTKGEALMHKLSDTIMEIHDIAKAPSMLYEELLDIREEHFQLVDDHEEMHQKFVDVNSCHEKLHASHDKLQTSHNKLKEEHTEARKKASMAGGLKVDISRLEKAVDKSKDENHDLKKEIERLTAELAKVNSLKHENAQLKKRIAQSAAQTEMHEQNVPVTATEARPPSSEPAVVVQTTKKKKGKKAGNTQGSAGEAAIVPTPSASAHSGPGEETCTNHKAEQELFKLKASHQSLTQDLAALQENLAQLEKFRRKAETDRDQATEKLQLEQAKSQNWQEIVQGHEKDKQRIQSQLEQSRASTTKIQSTVHKLEKNLSKVQDELAQQKAEHIRVKTELHERTQTPAVSEIVPRVSPDVAQVLHKIKSNVAQLVGDLDEARTYGGDLHNLINMIQGTVRDVARVIDQEVDEILVTSLESDGPRHVPDTVLPFIYHAGAGRLGPSPSYIQRAEHSPQQSPTLSFSSNLAVNTSGFPAHRPKAPPGFSDQPTSHGPFNGYPRGPENSPLTSRAFNATPSSTASFLNSSPAPLQLLSTNTHHAPGPIGSRSTNVPSAKGVVSKHTGIPSPVNTPAPSTSSGLGGLGNGAAGVDWSMWSKPAK